MFKVIGSSKITPRHQITLPDEVIKHLETQIGENVGYFLDEKTGRIYIMTQVND
jgi:bifunctional DNA-binding transcriptional regulator/antitoxin component of YhaV-PrlF toxin-antitoxin module